MQDQQFIFNQRRSRAWGKTLIERGANCCLDAILRRCSDHSHLLCANLVHPFHGQRIDHVEPDHIKSLRCVLLCHDISLTFDRQIDFGCCGFCAGHKGFHPCLPECIFNISQPVIELHDAVKVFDRPQQIQIIIGHTVAQAVEQSPRQTHHAAFLRCKLLP